MGLAAFNRIRRERARRVAKRVLHEADNTPKLVRKPRKVKTPKTPDPEPESKP